MYLARACQQFSQNDDAKDQEAGQPNKTHANVAYPGIGGSQPCQTGGAHIVALQISANPLFYAEAFCFIFWKQSYTKVQFTTIYTSHHVNVVQRMSAEPDNVCGFCVCRYCCWCWV